VNDIYQHKQLQERQNASPVLPASALAKGDVSLDAKLNAACRGENTRDKQRGRMSVHSVYVLSVSGKPLAPTTPAKARRLLKGGVAKKVWSKFNTFGIQMLEATRIETPDTTLGYDAGTKFEGISVVCGNENNLSVKLDLPDKRNIVRKMTERRILRRTRRHRNCRRRKPRFQNRNRKGFIAPSQFVIINSRLKVLREFCRIYPVQNAAIEDVRFNHATHRWGKNFSTMEIGKQKIRNFFTDQGIQIFEYRGFETAELRQKYGYKKTKIKNADKFSAHCSDSLALAVDVNCGERVPEGPFIVVDDTYRFYRRKLHYTQFLKDGIRKIFASGSVSGIGKGVIIGTNKGHIGQLCGRSKNSFLYYNVAKKRQLVIKLSWIKNQFKIKR
jgi:hypothetical protein